MDYREHALPSSLSTAIAAIWTLEAGRCEMAGAGEPVVPDGRAEIVVHFGDPFERVDEGRVTVQPALLFAGQLERALTLRPTGAASVLGIRLHPAAAPALIRIPQHELTGRTDDLCDASRPLAAWLTSVRDRARSATAAVPLVMTELPRLLKPERIDRRVAFAVDLIDRRASTARVSQIAGIVGITVRQLERAFRDQVGLGPRRLLRIRRLQRALSAMTGADEAPKGSTVALQGGYADQAHFIRECRALAGFTPGDSLLRRAELTRLFIES